VVIKNILRQKGRAVLTILGVSVGVTAILGLGALAVGLEAGYQSVLTSSNADLVLSEVNSLDITLSTVDEEVGDQLAAMPEVAAISGLMQGIVQTDNTPYFFIFGYPEDSFVLSRYQLTEGIDIYSPDVDPRGRPMMIGKAASESLERGIGDVVRFGEYTYRIVGIYETGDAFEEGGAVIRLEDAQEQLGQQRKVSLFYIQLDDPSLEDRLRQRVQRLYPDLELTTTEDLAGRNYTAQSMNAMVWGISALAILIGGIGMMNAQLMSVLERTREIGVLRAVGWKRRRILTMILGESVLICLFGGVIGIFLAWGLLYLAKDELSAFGAPVGFTATQLIQAFSVVFVLGITGGVYPAWRAAKLPPVEALRYDGGSTGSDAARLPVGGMAVQNLWRRKSRTLLTLTVIGLTIGGIVVVRSLVNGTTAFMNDFSGDAEVMVQQRDASDSGYAVIDEELGSRILAMPEVESVSGMMIAAASTEDAPIFVLQGYAPREESILRFNVVDGERISRNRQVMLGRAMADSLEVEVGESITLQDSRYRVVGIFESGQAWEELGGIVTLRDAQRVAGRPRKVTWFSVDVTNPNDAEAVVEQINAQYPEVRATLSGEFADSLPDMKTSNGMADGIAIMAILVGGIGVMNTMLMAVLERTREIGVLRALGWRRRAVLGLILREALALGAVGVLSGVFVALVMTLGLRLIPGADIVTDLIIWSPEIVLQAAVVAVVMGVVGGIYPAFRATRFAPVEALRYE